MAKKAKFTFIDLFAGIGGMRLAFQKLNGQCVFSSEWDEQAKTTYRTNFGEVPYGDITKIVEDEIPKHKPKTKTKAKAVSGKRKYSKKEVIVPENDVTEMYFDCASELSEESYV